MPPSASVLRLFSTSSFDNWTPHSAGVVISSAATAHRMPGLGAGRTMHRAPSRHSARYTELRPTPRASAIWATVSSRWSYIRRAALALSGVITVGRPPLRPRARAAALRAADRSRINSRSTNSASAPNTRKINRPPRGLGQPGSASSRPPPSCSYATGTCRPRWPTSPARPASRCRRCTVLRQQGGGHERCLRHDDRWGRRAGAGHRTILVRGNARRTGRGSCAQRVPRGSPWRSWNGSTRSTPPCWPPPRLHSVSNRYSEWLSGLSAPAGVDAANVARQVAAPRARLGFD